MFFRRRENCFQLALCWVLLNMSLGLSAALCWAALMALDFEYMLGWCLVAKEQSH